MVELPGWQGCQTWDIAVSQTSSFQHRAHFPLKYTGECLLSELMRLKDKQGKAGCSFRLGLSMLPILLGNPSSHDPPTSDSFQVAGTTDNMLPGLPPPV